MNMKNTKNSNIISKAKNTNPLRVLYKKSGQMPTVKIIPNIFLLKKAIIKRHLDIIPYDGLYIICNNKQLMKCMLNNIFLPLKTIRGDLLLIDIDKKEREFKSISQEDIIWYTQDLINKSYDIHAINKLKITPKESSERTLTYKSYNERDFEYDNNINFERVLLQILVKIELTLSNLLKRTE